MSSGASGWTRALRITGCLVDGWIVEAGGWRPQGVISFFGVISKLTEVGVPSPRGEDNRWIGGTTRESIDEPTWEVIPTVREAGG